jgi:hypothetical protein
MLYTYIWLFVLQMALCLAEASRYFACTDLFREPSKYAWSDYYEDHFILPNQRIALVTNKRVILLQVRLIPRSVCCIIVFKILIEMHGFLLCSARI